MNRSYLDDQSEILTIDGWKNIETLSASDIVLTLNLKRKFIEKDHIKDIEICSSYDGEIVRIKTCRKLDFIFTANHRLIYHRKCGGNVSGFRHDEYLVDQIKNISYYHFSLPFFGKWGISDIKPRIPIESFLFDTNDFFEFLGRFLGNGCLNNGCITITDNIKNQERISNINEIIHRLGFHPIVSREKYKNAVNTHFCNSRFAQILRNTVLLNRVHSRDRSVPINFLMNYSQEQLSFLFKGLLESDGSVHKNGEITYTSINEELANNFQILALQCGFNCALSRSIVKGFNDRRIICYTCTLSGFRRKKASFVVSKQLNHVTKEHYKGRMWSVSTNSSTLIIRRKGRVIVTGDCFSL